MGGGTTAVEALVAGRRFVGCDINPLSKFVARAKTTPLGDGSLAQVIRWTESLITESDLRSRTEPDPTWEEYQANIPWWIRNVIEVALARTESIKSENARSFARSVLLRTGQWALDCRRQVPTARQFLQHLRVNSEAMAKGMREYRESIRKQGLRPEDIGRRRRLILGDVTDSVNQGRVPSKWLPPRLILTSPPYLGVHILYHRWQVRGRRESRAPFWITGSLDGFGGSHYTFGDRKRKDPENYLTQFRSCLKPVVEIMGKDSLMVQLVAFAKPEDHLHLYLEALRSAGLEETEPSGSERNWRNVPNRKWYAQLNGSTSSSKEYLLVHRKA
jgi:hypothetical protein